ncbi:MAG TPA: DUF4242 domain-containing protein [Chitinophagales bacterium]|nr:DUF4242 domain-containing protein [Chitinophagales bacterium]
MPIYMDAHNVPGVKAKDAAEAHRKDLLIQEDHHCKCMTYWIDEERENIFCLIEAPDKNTVVEMHNKAHGMIPHKIIEVSTNLVASFLGRIYDPSTAEITGDGLPVFSDSPIRILLVTSMTDPVLLQYRLGMEKASALINQYTNTIRKNLSLHEGTEVEHKGIGFIASFISAGKAVSCALAISRELSAAGADTAGFRMVINSGEPVVKSEQLFGDTIQLANYMFAIDKNFQIAVGAAVRELISKDYFQLQENNHLTLAPDDEAVLNFLFSKLEQNWQQPEFNVTEYCRAMMMSKSQLYRKTMELTGLSPNLLLKEFRLEKAKELLKHRRYSISQITFDCGFSSPSYFTKCFKKKYGLLPMTYIDLLH